MTRAIISVAFLIATTAASQSRGDDQPDQPATLARQILRDKQQRQVLINVRMIEVSLTKMREMGLNYPWLTDSPQTKDDAKPSSDDQSKWPGLLVQQRTGAVTPGIGIANPTVIAFLEDLQKKGLTKTIAEPTLIALIGRDAYFHSGSQVPILQQRVNGKLSTEFATIGSELTFKCEALGGDRIRLTVKSRFAEFDKTLEVSTGDRVVPGLNVRQCGASAELASGDTVVLGGMPNKVIESTRRHGKVTESVVEKELLVLVTAKLIDAPVGQDAVSIANRPSGYYGSTHENQPHSQARPTGRDATEQLPARIGEK
jgi:Flp pilus assembly secretin CpaC